MTSLAGELISRYNDPQVKSADTSGANINLNMGYTKERFFSSTDPIAAPASVQISRDARTTLFRWKFTMAALVAITFPDDFVMSDALFDDATKEWTPLDLGDYSLTAWWDGTSWTASIVGPDN